MDNQAEKKDKVVSMEEFRAAMSIVTSRLQLATQAGIQFGGSRDMYEIFGWPKELKAEHLLSKYQRQDLASRIVNAPPGATWSGPPTIKEEGTLKTEWEEMVKDPHLKLLDGLYRVDRLSRMNKFSLLLLGFNDTGDLSKPVKAGKGRELLYVKPIAGRQCTEITFNDNTRDKRYGLPEMYKIKFDDPSDKKGSGNVVNVGKHKDLVIHWTRCVHVVEDPLEDNVFGTPILEKVYNQLEDLLKVGGGTAEVYWLTGNRGLHANIDKEMEIDPADASALSDEITEYQHQLRRVIRTRGVDLKTLDSSTPNPKETFEMQIAIISGTTGIPRRILVGSEAGQLASEQDRANWAERIEERRVLTVNPYILSPVVLRLQHAGLLSEGNPEWVWPSAFIQNPLEIGQTQAQIARSVGNLSRQTGASTPMQIMSREECRKTLGFEGDLTESEMFEPPDYLQKNPTEPVDPANPGKGTKDKSEEEKQKRAEKKQDQQVSDRDA